MGALLPVPIEAVGREVDGQRMWRCPSNWNDDNIRIVRPGGCRGCTHADAHGIAEWLGRELPAVGSPVGRYGVVPTAARPTVQMVNRVQTKLFLHSRIHHGLIGDRVLYNAGQAADNASQRWIYEIVGAGPGWIDLKGEHPALLPLQASRVNPEWPFADPVTGTYGRLVFMGGVTSMPAGAVVEFQAPSILAGKVFPMISRVVPPSASGGLVDRTFRVELGGFDASNARRPYDARFPPAGNRYVALVRWQALARERWIDPQNGLEVQATRRRIVVEEAGPVVLTDSGGNAAKVWVDSVRLFSGVEVPVAELLTVGGPGDDYETVLDLTGYPGAVGAVLEYAVAARAEDGVRVPTIGKCKWAKRDPSGSWIHGTEEHCAKATVASGFAGFHDGCWQPTTCDQFRLEDDGEETVGNAEFWASLWTRAGWVLFQGIPGISSHRNFWLVWREGASVAGLVGSWSDGVFGGKFEKREEWNSAPLGRLVTWRDGDGHDGLGVVKGAVWEQAHRFPETSDVGDGDVEYRANANGTFRLGTVGEEVEGWMEGKSVRERWPWKWTASTSVYEFQTTSGSMRTVNWPRASEAYVVRSALALAGGAEASRIRGIYGG